MTTPSSVRGATAAAITRLESELRLSPIVDDAALLEPMGRRRLEAARQALAVRGLRAVVLLLPRRTPLEPYHVLWERLALRERDDLLLIFSGFGQWWARGWGLDEAVIRADLDRAAPALELSYGRGLFTALDQLAQSTGRGPTPPADVPSTTVDADTGLSPTGLLGAGVGAMLVVGAVTWLVIRRRRISVSQGAEATGPGDDGSSRPTPERAHRA